MYDDIINKKYPFVLKHKRMSTYERCAQFMPFSALTGYSNAIKETARLTENKIILDEEIKEILDNKLNKIKENIKANPVITITHYIKDQKKDGGTYENITGIVKKIDLYKGEITIENKKIQINNIINITSEY